MILKYWHFLMLKYYAHLISDARDPILREKLINKLEYHSNEYNKKLR